MLPVQDQGDTLPNAFTSLSFYHYIDEQKIRVHGGKG